jgi:hypothetical protein
MQDFIRIRWSFFPIPSLNSSASSPEFRNNLIEVQLSSPLAKVSNDVTTFMEFTLKKTRECPIQSEVLDFAQ